jgi:NitT/TauT family transport system permease protein
MRTLIALWIGRIAIAALIIVLWWGLVRFAIVDKFLLSSPDDVFRYLIKNFTKEILPNALDTLIATLIAFFFAAVSGMLAGMLLVEVKYLQDLLDPFLTALNSLPRVALAPIFILWFGIGVVSKIAVAYSLAFFIVLTATLAGMKNVDPILLRLGRSLGCSGWQQFKKITLPWAIPSVFAGFKLALIYSFLGVVTSEMIASKTGLGKLVIYYSGILRMDAVLANLFVMAGFAVVLTMIADRFESALLGNWIEVNQSSRRQ